MTPLSMTAENPSVSVCQETRSLDSKSGGDSDFSSASTDVCEEDLGRYSAALLQIPADDFEVTDHELQVKFLSNRHRAVENIECSEQLKNSVLEGHAGDRATEKGPSSSAAMYQSDRTALSWYQNLESSNPIAAAAAPQSVTPSSSSVAAPAYHSAQASLERWESGAAIGFANPVGIEVFVRHRREHSHGFAGMGYGQSISQFLASRAVVDRANAWKKASRS